MNVLIVGGSSGLGLAMAKEFSDAGDKVIVTGRHDPQVDFAEFQEFQLTGTDLPARVEKFVSKLTKVDRLVYSAGLYVDGKVTDLAEDIIDNILDVSARGLIFFVRSLLNKQDELSELITITSMSQWVVSATKPVYNFVKAGMGLFSEALAGDGRISKVLVVGPSTMNSDDGPLNPKFADKPWIAKEIAKIMNQQFKFKTIRILNNPPRLEEVEKR